MGPGFEPMESLFLFTVTLEKQNRGEVWTEASSTVTVTGTSQRRLERSCQSWVSVDTGFSPIQQIFLKLLLYPRSWASNPQSPCRHWVYTLGNPKSKSEYRFIFKMGLRLHFLAAPVECRPPLPIWCPRGIFIAFSAYSASFHLLDGLEFAEYEVETGHGHFVVWGWPC